MKIKSVAMQHWEARIGLIEALQGFFGVVFWTMLICAMLSACSYVITGNNDYAQVAALSIFTWTVNFLALFSMVSLESDHDAARPNA